MTQALTSLARLTLRQLRQMASDLGVTLYSRKSKQDLVSAIAERQDRVSESPAVTETELTESSRTDAKTRVVFLPRDPQWAYVFWEITDLDRKRAQGDGAGHLSLRLADVTGMQDGALKEENYVNKVYPQVVAGRLWSAIQVTTAAGICSVVDIVLSNPDQYEGFVAQEQFSLPDILENRFGQIYAHGGSNIESSELVARGETGYQRA